MFSLRACICLKGSPFLFLHTYRQHLSIHFCDLITCFFYHTLAWQSNSNALSTHACTILACHVLDNLVFFSCSFAFAHRPPALRNLIFTSSFVPTHDPSTLILSLSSMQKSRHSSFWSLFLSSNLPITSFIAFTPPSISSFVPTIVVSSANNNSRNRTSFTSLPFLSHVPVPANELLGIHLHSTPTSDSQAAALASPACLNTAWW